ncbi:MAG: trehalose-6-phosphate synthase [Candidatus Saccharibacteria bacterium]|nr:MAG: trehalose-6-phosphate synthase [Candidatus Saccharibacteria bacterium]
MVSRLIVASNRLPVSVVETSDGLSLSRSNGGLATALASLFQQDTSLWVGWTGLRRHITDKELASLNIPPFLQPINLTDEEITLYYDMFANGILWPVAHGLAATTPFTEEQWSAVQQVTKHFADTIERILQPSDRIWIHDYHLILLPAELARRGIKNKIGFFLHTPLPTAVDFQKLPHAAELLSSLLSVDILGMQVSRDVTRLHKIQQTMGIKKSRADIKAFPIGIDFDSFDSLNDSKDALALTSSIKKQVKDKTIILSMSRLDYTKGVRNQLHAFEALIAEYPERESLLYRLNVAPSRESVLEYRSLKNEIEALVQKINKKYGTKTWQPIDYTYENMGLEELAAWYRASDIHFNVPVADGMNLIAKEYVAARRDPGVLIISDTMGAAEQLQDAIIIPPEDVAAAHAALLAAIKMPAHEKAVRWKKLRHNVKTHHVTKWANDFIKALEK